MGRPKKWPPSILTHKPSGRDRLRWNGIDYWLGASGSEESRREYARLVGLLAAGESPGRHVAPAGPTVAEVAAAWEREEAPSKDARELSAVRRALLVVVRLHGGTPAASFGLAELEDVQRAMGSGSWMTAAEKEALAHSPGKKVVGWCRNRVNAQVRRARTVWRWAERRRLAPPGSWAALRALPPVPAHDHRVRQTAKVRAATQDDLDAVLSRLRSAPVRAMLHLQFLAGMRSGEVRRMRAGEVDRPGPVWVFTPREHKNAWRGQERVIALGPKAQEVLKPWLVGKAPEAFVFLSRNGRPYTTAGYGQLGRRAGLRAGLPWFRPLCLRHGARLRISRECGLEASRAILGHTTVSMTAQYAAGADLETAMKTAALLG